MRTDLVDSGLYICNGFCGEKTSKHITSCFEENFGANRMREDFLAPFLASEIDHGTFHVSVMQNDEYCGKIVDFRTYGRVCSDILKRWVHPFGIHNLERSLFTSKPN
jgi:hypothetical protein